MRNVETRGAPVATLPRAQEILGGIEVRLAVNAGLIDGFAGDFDDGIALSPAELNAIKFTVTNHAVSVVGDALSLSGNHRLSRANPRAAPSRRSVRPRAHAPG